MSEPRAAQRAVPRIATCDLREVTMITLSMTLLIAGTFTSLISHHRVSEFIGNHMGGLGVVGLLASLAAHIAMRKGRAHKTAFLLASMLPISLGVLVVLAVYILTGFEYCGGGVVLAAAIIVPVVYACLRKRSHPCGHDSTGDPEPIGAPAKTSHGSRAGSY